MLKVYKHASECLKQVTNVVCSNKNVSVITCRKNRSAATCFERTCQSFD